VRLSLRLPTGRITLYQLAGGEIVCAHVKRGALAEMVGTITNLTQGGESEWLLCPDCIGRYRTVKEES
jgi:hypothetical protein